MVFYIVYKIINNVNGMIYIGAHKTPDINDNYMGSGIWLKRAQYKYGLENFTKEIIAIYDNPKEMFEKEAELVNNKFLMDGNCYNLKLGGSGGWEFINSDEEFRIAKNKKARISSNSTIRQLYGVENPAQIESVRTKLFDAMKTRWAQGEFDNRSPTFLGKTHSAEAKQKIGKANSIHQKSDGNSQFGTMWITNEECNKKIKKNEPIPVGWKKGRVAK